MNKLVIGILAHVDAGKTSLTEGLLYATGQLRKKGRVDHGDAFLDTYQLEKERGITIYSKPALLETKDLQITILDTPGHVDFSAEMERALQVLDVAVLVVSGADGIQSHTMTLWKLLERYHIPTFLFLNKMDSPDTYRDRLLSELRRRFGDGFYDFSEGISFPDVPDIPEDASFPPLSSELLEEISLCDEAYMEYFLEEGTLSKEQLIHAIAERKIYLCFFGSALKQWGIRLFLSGLCTYAPLRTYPEAFGARIYKISRDEAGNRLTFLKVTGGSLKVKTLLSGGLGEEAWEEKIDQIRLYSGSRFQLLPEAEAGSVVAVTGLSKTRAGDGLGKEGEAPLPLLEPVLNYCVLLPPSKDAATMLYQMRQLEEEDPMLRVVWDERAGEIHVMLMGEVQTEILKRLIWDRFRVPVEFDVGNVVFKETISGPAIGVGHFEPLRHYAEVHLLLEPGERGSGLSFYTALSEDVLDKNWQRLILTHLLERSHPGVLTGNPITDMQITLVNGRAHEKHTEGGDFRQATYRAVRCGLKKAPSVLLEPWYDFRLEIPSEFIGRAMNDIQVKGGKLSSPELIEDWAILTGSCAVRTLRNYPQEVVSYTGGRGKMSVVLGGYEPCPDQDKVVAELGYDSEADIDNPTGSVFCAHGAGFVVPWDQVSQYQHLDDRALIRALNLPNEKGSPVKGPEEEETPSFPARGSSRSSSSYSGMGSYAEEEELMAIFERTFGQTKGERYRDSQVSRHYAKPLSQAAKTEIKVPGGISTPPPDAERYLLVDGYNILFAWPELASLAKADVGAAQLKLMDILSNYQGLRPCTLILVFDAYKLTGHAEEVFPYHNIHVVYTKEAETADMYIEKTVHKLAKKHEVTVATSDGTEQIIIMGGGARRLSAQTLKEEIEAATLQMHEELRLRRRSSKNYLFDQVDEKTAAILQDIGEEKKKAAEKG
ncbi:MAG: TetM/TetW/TetO/TetS family tetracycline resistance ribosomal protection protein [Blautia sp.]|nr:TetM/TetW/TetO/TetS family tetracycline resistance ribosomal protection protein [Blautia sp.]